MWIKEDLCGTSSWPDLERVYQLKQLAFMKIKELEFLLLRIIAYILVLHTINMTLRKFIALAFVSALCLPNSYGQSKADKSSALVQIKQVFKQINSYKNYKVVTIDDSEEFLGHSTDNGGSLKGYYKGDSLKKIVEWVGLSNRVVQNDYYFNDGKLLFVYSTDSRCKANDKTGEMDCSKFEKVFKGRYYFNDDKLIDTILSDKEHEGTKHQDATGFLTAGKDYMKLLKARRQ